MTRLTVLLRGINVSGRNKVPMAELRAALTAEGFDGVSTYIQSGNIALDLPVGGEIADVVRAVTTALDENFDVHVPVIAIDQATVGPIADDAPFDPDQNPAYQIIYFADHPVDGAGVAEIDRHRYAGDEITAAPMAVYVAYGGGQSTSKLTIDVLERAAGTSLTGRNVRSAEKLRTL